MSRRILAMLAILVGFSSVAPATDLSLRVEALGCHSSQVSIGPSCETSYQVVGELSDAESDGLSMVVFDLEFSGGALAPAGTPTALPMLAFAPPDGLANPAGYGGTPTGGRLVQVGGSQNVLGHGIWPCEENDECPGTSTCVDGICTALPDLPIGTVTIGAGQPGAPASIVSGQLLAPSAPGTYTLQLMNPVANVFEKGVDGRPYWWSEPVAVGSLTALTITVLAGEECCDEYEACCLSDASCTYLPPAECTALGGSPSGLECEGDSDGDGWDGLCGDQCPNDPAKLTPGLCGCGLVDTDSDLDGTPDCHDGCPLDPGKTQPGACGCGVADTDSDQDGTPDCVDGCPADPEKTEPGLCGCGVSEVDSDGDTIPDCNDVCPDEDDRIDQDDNGIPDCLEAEVPAVSTTGLLVTVFLLAVVSGYYLRRRRAAN